MIDGDFTFYMVQHRERGRGNIPARWVQSDLGHFLFRELPFDDRRGQTGEDYRLLIAPTQQCWQRTMVHAFLRLEDAVAAREAVELEAPDHKFRVVRRHVTQTTEVIEMSSTGGKR